MNEMQMFNNFDGACALIESEWDYESPVPSRVMAAFNSIVTQLPELEGYGEEIPQKVQTLNTMYWLKRFKVSMGGMYWLKRFKVSMGGVISPEG